MKMHLKISSAKLRSLSPGIYIYICIYIYIYIYTCVREPVQFVKALPNPLTHRNENENRNKIWTFSFETMLLKLSSTKCGSYIFRLIVFKSIFTHPVTVTSHDRHGVSNHQQLDYLFNSLIRLITRKISLMALCQWWPNRSPDKGAVTRKAFLCHDVIM